MSIRPLDHIRRFNGNAYWDWQRGWTMPDKINTGPRLPACKHMRNITEIIPLIIPKLPHRAIRRLMAPNCKGGCS